MTYLQDLLDTAVAGGSAAAAMLLDRPDADTLMRRFWRQAFGSP